MIDTLDGEYFEGEALAEGTDGLDQWSEGESGSGGPDQAADEFGRVFRRIKRAVAKTGITRVLRTLAPMAAQAIGGAVGGPLGAQIGARIGALANSEAEAEDGFDAEEENAFGEDRADAFGLDSLDDAFAEQMAGEAVRATSSSEADAYLGGVTIQILSSAPIEVRRLAPEMTRGAVRLGRMLRSSARTRPLTATVAGIQKRVTRELTRQVRRGRVPTPRDARALLAREASRQLGSARRVTRLLANNHLKRHRLARINLSAIGAAER